MIYNRTDGDLGKRLDGFTLKVLDSASATSSSRRRSSRPRSSRRRFDRRRRSRRNGVDPPRGDDRADVRPRPGRPKPFKALAPFVERRRRSARRHPGAAAHSQPPTGRKEEAKPLLDSLLAYVRKVPGRGADRPGGARRAATRPTPWRRCCRSTRPSKVRKELGELGVRVDPPGTVPDQMLYDKERLVVQAGKPVEIVFENTDLMPHNFVIVAARLAGGGRPAGRSRRRAARTPSSGNYVPALATRSCWPAGCSSRASRRS